MWELRWSTAAARDFRTLDPTTTERINEALDELRENPYTATNVKKLRNADAAYRKRVGDHRILFDIVGHEVHILAIKPRAQAY